MTLRRFAIALVTSVVCASVCFAADRATSENFEVVAPTKQLAETFAKAAEAYRKEKALEWLGEEMPRWKERCPLVVEVNPTRTGGATTFTFSPRGGVAAQEMKIFGKVDSLLESVLPHEVTHTVLAHHFGVPVPRWADEGGSVLSENDHERLEHDIKCREFLNAERGIPLRHLLPMKEYPKDTIVLYAQGFSVSNYLIDRGGGGLEGRRKFLQFLETGMARGGRNWDAAVKSHYGYDGVDDLQEKWIASLRTPPVAKGKAAEKLRGEAVTTGRGGSGKTETRTNANLGVPQLEPPVVNAARAASPAFDDRPRASGSLPPLGSVAPAPSQKLPPAPRLLPPEIPVGK
ncbi:MAG: hypothetical protein MUF18_08840 [Fimbriiglobus sp.]|jgi:hypothetical protein|nr:hypothetical protein [Fimbriiglobus sp.]